jgi:rod shape determining protein RodA
MGILNYGVRPLIFLSERSAVDPEPQTTLDPLARLHLDTPLLLGLLSAVLIGLVVLYSSSQQDLGLLLRQVAHLGLGFVVLVAVAQVPLRYLRHLTPWLYGAGILLLVGVLLFGTVRQGAQRWLNLGIVQFQPSELMKLAVPMMLAWYLTTKPLPPRWPYLIVGVVIILLPVLLILKQPDLGTALLVAMTGAVMLFLAGVSWRLITALVAVLVAATPLFWQFGMRDYQRQRVLTFLNPESDPLGAGWNIIQSKIAIGSGGLYGKGWLNGTQSQLEFLPEGSTDFIFAVFAEEFGLIGVGILIGVYLFLVVRGLFIALRARTTYARLLAGSLIMIFFIYIFVNMGMVSGLLPVVGLPLPLISYGGTALVTIMAGFGMLMNIATHRFRT